MILANIGSSIFTLLLAFSAFRGHLGFLEIAALFGMTTCCNMLNMLACTASTVLLVEKENLGRASGITQFGYALSTVLSPLLGGVMVLTIGVFGVLLIDFASYLFAIFTILSSRVPRPPSDSGTHSSTLFREASSGFRYMKHKPGLLQLSLYLAVVNFVCVMAAVLKPPLLLSFTSVAGMGSMLSVEGLGLVSGMLLMTIWGGPNRLSRGVLLAGGTQSIALLLIGIQPRLMIVGTGLFIGALALPIMNGCNLVLLQRSAPPELQGRVLAASQVLAQGLCPLGALVAGPLADRIFKPLLLAGAGAASVFGRYFGVGPGRGIGLLLAVMALVIVVATLIAALLPEIQHLALKLRDYDHESPGLIVAPEPDPLHP